MTLVRVIPHPEIMETASVASNNQALVRATAFHLAEDKSSSGSSASGCGIGGNKHRRASLTVLSEM